MFASGKKGSEFDSRIIVYRNVSTPQTVPTGTWTKLELDSIRLDNLNEYDETTNYRFTATEAGVYHVALSVDFQSMAADKGAKCGIGWNGNSPAATVGYLPIGSTSTISAGGDDNVMCSGSFELTQNSYLEAFVWHNHGSDRSIVEPSVMSIERFA